MPEPRAAATSGAPPGGPGAPLRIDQVVIVPLDLVPARKRTIPTGPIRYGGPGGWVGRPVLLGLRGGGLTGWGEIRPVNPFQGETAASVVAALRDFYGPFLLGRDAWRRDAILHECDRRLPANRAALAVVDVALHDLLGRASGLPVHALLGGACRDRIPLEWSVGLGSADAMVREAIEAVETYGLRYVCVKVGPPEREAEDLRIVHELRRRVGEGVAIGIDANGSYDARGAIRLARRLEEAGLAYFEQPVPGWAVDDLKRVRDGAGIPVMADEAVATLHDAHRVAAAGAADVLAVKLYKCGGLWAGRRIAIAAEAAGCGVNGAGTAIGSHLEALAAAHLCAAVPNLAFGAEFVMGLPVVEGDPVAPGAAVAIEEGSAIVPGGPGLGIEVDERAVSAHALGRFVVE